MSVSLAEFCAALTDLNLVSGEEFRDIMAGRTAGQVADVEQFAKSLIARKTLTKYQAQAILSGQAKRLVLGSYLLVDQIGQGGMGVVLKARHLRLKRFVAIKVLSPQVTKNPVALKRFQREVQAAAKLEHPNIVAAFDADVARNVHFLVMQYIEGRDLATTIQEQGPFSVEQALQCLSQAACGLEYAHSQGIIHRDIKPANFILEKGTGIIKVLDMGLARIDEACGLEMEGGDTGLTHTGTIMGTVDFMSPEQAANTKKADCRSDIYSLGVTLYYLLTGELLYNGDTMMEKLLAHRERPIPSLRQIRSDVPEAVDAVFRKMVAKNPADRYQTMTDTLADLLACLSGAPTSVPVGTFRAVAMGDSMDSEFRAFVSGLDSDGDAQTAFVPGQSDEVRPPTTDGGSQATKPGSATHGPRKKTGPKSKPELKSTSSSTASFHWKVVGIASTVLLLLCFVVWLMNGRKATPTTSRKSKSTAKSAPRVKSEQQPDIPAIEIGAPAIIAKLPPMSPSDSPLNHLPGLLLEPGPIKGIKRWQVETNAPRSAVSAADWAPDNRQIIVGFQSGELRIYEPATWQLRGLLSGHEGGVRSVSWNPEGSRIASSGNDNAVRLWQGDGTPGPALRHCANPGVVVWSPDGLHLLAASNDRNRPVIQMWSADGQPEALYMGHTQPAKSLGWSADARHFISASEDGSLRIWDLNGKQIREITVTDKRFQVVRWSRLGAIAAYDHEGNIYLFPDAAQPPSIKYKLSPRGMVWSPDGEQLAVGFNTDVQIWDPEGQTISQQSNVEAPYLRWSLDGKHLLACGKSIVVWEPGGEVAALQQLPWATAIACDPSGRQFITGYSDGSLHWSGPAGRPTQTVTVPDFYVSSLAWSPDGQTVAVGGRNQIRLFTADGQASATIDAKVGVQQVKWSPDGKQMAVVSSDAKIRLFHVDGGAGLVLEGHTQQVISLDWSTDGQLVSVSRDKTVRLWKADGSPGPEVAPIANTEYYASTWSPDGKQFAAVIGNKTNTRIQIWNADGSIGPELKGPKGLYSFAWSRDGENIIAAESSGEFRTWTRDGQAGPSYPGTFLPAKALVISGQNRVLTLADDRAVRGWDATTFKPLWVTLATADHETATVNPDGKVTHAKGQADHVFVFLTEQDTGRIEVLTQSQFQRLNGKSK